MDVDHSSHGIDCAQPVKPWFATGQPEQAGKHPVPPRMQRVELGCPDFAGRTPAAKHRPRRMPGADLRPHDMPAAWRAVAAIQFAGAVTGRGDRVGA